jgi:Cu-processing system permease protein
MKERAYGVPAPFCAVLRRELRDALINCYFQIFAVLSVLAGFAATFFSEEVNAISFFIMQISLYVVTLFAVLSGVSSAQAEREEWPLMFSQPVSRSAYVVGKFIAYLGIFVATLVLIFIPGLVAGAEASQLGILYFETVMLAASCVALGLAAGFMTCDRARAMIGGVSAWLLLLFGVDFLALSGAHWVFVQRIPDLWILLLMLNPLDAFRIQALFGLEQIPAEAANKTVLASWWIAHAGGWFALIATLWCAGTLALAGFHLNRWEE